jgi:hypothetical protein
MRCCDNRSSAVQRIDVEVLRESEGRKEKYKVGMYRRILYRFFIEARRPCPVTRVSCQLSSKLAKNGAK